MQFQQKLITITIFTQPSVIGMPISNDVLAEWRLKWRQLWRLPYFIFPHALTCNKNMFNLHPLLDFVCNPYGIHVWLEQKHMTNELLQDVKPQNSHFTLTNGIELFSYKEIILLCQSTAASAMFSSQNVRCQLTVQKKNSMSNRHIKNFPKCLLMLVAIRPKLQTSIVN